MDYIKKIDGYWIPKLGFGTFNLTGREARGVLEFALDVGYRHFDTAQVYQNEDDIGSVLGNTSIPRDRLFITTKVWGTNLTEDKFLPSVEQSLKNMQLDHVDLLLIHWPNRNIPLDESLEQLVKAQEKEYCKLIGVSNFTVDLLEQVQQKGVRIACNQFEYHPFISQEKLLAKTRELGAFATAYTPLARGEVVENSLLKHIALKHKVKPAQVALRWLVQQEDVVAIPKSAQLYRIKQNFDVFNFHLTEDEMEEINTLQSENRRFIDPEFAPAWD